MLFGIPNNKWHGILAFAVTVSVFMILWGFWRNQMAPAIGSAATYLLFFMIALLVAHYLQCWNEARQARDPRSINIYRSWKNFMEDSEDDFRWFWRGAIASIIPTAILALIF